MFTLLATTCSDRASACPVRVTPRVSRNPNRPIRLARFLKRITQPIDITTCHYPFHTNECHTSRLRSRFEDCRDFTSKLPARNETCKKSAPDGNQNHTTLEAPCVT